VSVAAAPVPALASATAATHAAAATIRTLGRTRYVECWSSMRSFTDARDAGTPDELWLTEHEPVFTLGLAGRAAHVLDAGGTPVIKVDRGGQVTYHGPGQLLVYTLLDLKRRRLGVRALVRTLEAAVVDCLAAEGVAAYGKPSAPGVYVAVDGRESKIAALGLKVRNGCTYHGLALNVAMDLRPFAGIDPCGYPGLAVTDLASLGVRASVATAGTALARHVLRRLDDPVRLD
jgi:lipoyl(octanoyl) transferase